MALSLNYKEDGVTLEWRDGQREHADFVDSVFPDRTCGQYDAGIIAALESTGREFFISLYSAEVYGAGDDGTLTLARPDVRCPEIAVIVAVQDAQETFQYDESGAIL